MTAEIILALYLTGAVAKTLKASSTQEPVTFDKTIPIKVEELPLENGMFPLTVRCEDAHLTAPNTLDRFYCLAINNTGKNISAMASELTVITETSGGLESRNTTAFIDDSFVHPDVRAARRLKLTSSGAARTIQPAGPITFDEPIKRVELTIKYVEFDDRTSIGSDSDGSRAIHSIREGAARYKEWLVNKYTLNKNSVETVAPLLNNEDIPPELKFGDDKNLSQGAKIYRQALRNILEAQGSSELHKILTKKNKIN